MSSLDLTIRAIPFYCFKFWFQFKTNIMEPYKLAVVWGAKLDKITLH